MRETSREGVESIAALDNLQAGRAVRRLQLRHLSERLTPFGLERLQSTI
jgi:hypothetical protein